MKTTNAGEDTNQAPKGLIIEVVGTGWRHLGGDLWESPCGETYVGIDLARDSTPAEEGNKKPLQ